MTDRRAELYPPAVEAYWEAVEDGRLTIPQCEECEETFFPPRAACPYCLSESLTLVNVSGTGQVYSYSIVRTEGHPAREEPPYPVALVTLDEGPTVFSTIVDCPVDNVAVDMCVTVEFRELGNDQVLPVFTPA